MVYLNVDLDTKALVNEAVTKYKVAYVPGESFFPVSRRKNTMRLNFSYPPPEKIREGVKRIATLVKEKIKA